MLQDFETDMSEDDLTHFEEITELHDYGLDEGISSVDEMKARCEANFENRCMHHHVFDLPLVVRALTHVGFKVELSERYLGSHIVAIASKRV
jgi:hypothetical protein